MNLRPPSPELLAGRPILRWCAIGCELVGIMETRRPRHDPALALFLLYLIGRASRGEPNFLIFNAHRERLDDALWQFSRPLGGADDARYAFWRFRAYSLWRIDGRDGFLAGQPDAELPDGVTPEAAIGSCDATAWRALKSWPFDRYRIANDVLAVFWPQDVHDRVRACLRLPGGPRFEPER